jgi:SNF2 family DNA or RNA helicase
VFIVAKNGGHENWVGEFELDLPLGMLSRARFLVHYASKAQTKKYEAEVVELLGHKGLAVLCMSYDAFMTDKGRDVAKRFLVQRKCLYVLDEAHRAKNPATKRVKRLLASAPYAKIRRVLTGTPISKGPFDVWSQVQFACPGFWDAKGVGDFEVFKAMFGVFHNWKNPETERIQRLCVGYRNLPLLHKWLMEVGSRVTKDVLNLPPKLYTRSTYELSREQERVYDELVDGAFAELPPEGYVSSNMAMTLMLRLHQVCCGYVPMDHDLGLHMFKDNPRLEQFQEDLQDVTSGCIIWCCFTNDIDLILAHMKDKGMEAVRYDGKTSDDDKLEAKQRFSEGKVQFFVANPAAAGESLTLLHGTSVMYYSQNCRLLDRLQSEDRSHRKGQLNKVLYRDYEALRPGGGKTVERAIVRNLQGKVDVASQITGDELREWIK